MPRCGAIVRNGKNTLGRLLIFAVDYSALSIWLLAIVISWFQSVSGNDFGFVV